LEAPIAKVVGALFLVYFKNLSTDQSPGPFSIKVA